MMSNKNYMKHIIWIVLFPMLLLVPSILNAAVTLTLKQVPNNVSNDYDVDNEVVVTETFTVKHKGDATDYFVTFSAGDSGNFDPRQMSDGTGNFMDYQIYDGPVTRNILKDLSASPSSSEILSGNFAYSKGWQEVILSFTVVLTGGQIPIAATYSDVITINLYEGTPASPILKDSASSNIKSKMNAILDLSIVETGAPFDPNSTGFPLDFGTLVQGISRSSDLITRSNAFYSISIESTNAGVMLITDPADTSTVPYTFYFDGTTINLGAGTPVTVTAGASPTDSSGTRYPMVVEIGDYGLASAGNYEDVISITASAD